MTPLVALVADFRATSAACLAGGGVAWEGEAPAVEQSHHRHPGHQQSRQQVAHTELLTHVLAVPGAQPVFNRNRQLKMPIHMKSTKCQ